jgi:hypothetical protein
MGYLCMGRTFAYFGVPMLHLFVGEVVLVLFFLFGPRAGRGAWLWQAIDESVFRRFRRIFIFFLIFGLCQALRGIYLGHPALLAARDLALNYYPFYFFLGLWVGLTAPGYLQRFFRTAAWANGVYGMCFILLFSRIPWSFAGFSKETVPVQVFGPPEFSAVILIGLLSFEREVQAVWSLLLLNAAVLVGMLIRAEWMAFAIGLVLWAHITKNLTRTLWLGVAVVLLLGVMYVTNFTIPGPEMRGGTISAQELVARVIAPVNADAAGQFSSDDADLRMYEANALWRTVFWSEIWSSIHEDTSRAIFGYGYGYPLNDLVPDLAGETTRTPHNVFFYVLAYTGWVGVAIFAWFQLALARMLWKVFQARNTAFGIVCWASLMVFAMFTPFFEVPQGAIPFYLLTGCACAGLLDAGARHGQLRVSNREVCARLSSPSASNETGVS